VMGKDRPKKVSRVPVSTHTNGFAPKLHLSVLGLLKGTIRLLDPPGLARR